MSLHWNYFIALEDSLDVLSRYIAFDPRNYGTFSVECARMLMAATQEVDVLLRAMCQHGGSGADNIPQYHDWFTANQTQIFAAQTTLKRDQIVLRPFGGWTRATSPPWWSANNAVKHRRGTDFDKASLENVLNATAAVLVASIFHHNVTTGTPLDPEPDTKLFAVDNAMRATRGNVMNYCYRVPTTP